MTDLGFGATLTIAMVIAIAALIGAAMLARRQQKRMNAAAGSGDLAQALGDLAGELKRSNDLIEAHIEDHEARLHRLETERAAKDAGQEG
ncbi:MAG: hypothetical protein C0606_13875 [Hyphomicrobiales bacterium]|nr:MAG: hypothetical protein C0606_13875 [Hyphomicrobiales bacterium]